MLLVCPIYKILNLLMEFKEKYLVHSLEVFKFFYASIKMGFVNCQCGSEGFSLINRTTKREQYKERWTV
ncbi:hypothetical protein CSV73_04600 [Sporosarcina sp. P1]|nr:hypothetical protein CSV73_04600 [Sporosarcina sp. P1]